MGVSSFRLDLDLETDAHLLEVALHGVEARVFVEDHHARVELLEDVVEIELGGLLVVVEVDQRHAVAKARRGEFPEDLKAAGAGERREEVTAEDVTAVVGAIARVVAAQLAVFGVFRFHRERPALRDLAFEQEVDVPGLLVAALYLAGDADGEDVLVAV